MSVAAFEERSNLVLALDRVLYVNGQATDEILALTGQLGSALGLRTRLVPRWGELRLYAEDNDAKLVLQSAADPAGVDMDRVASAMGIAEKLGAGQLSPEAAVQLVASVAQTPPAPTWLFALAAAAGAVALAVLFGVQHFRAAALIFVSAGAGAIVRRALGRRSSNVYIQPFCAALLAGIVGALAVRYELSSSLRLVAVCPCMVLVPGPHVLNAALDLIEDRIHLGAARLIHSGLVIVAISVGLLLGLALLGVSLPVDPAGRSVPLWQDVIAAGVAVASYSVFFSTPARMMAWPLAVGMAAHALRWGALALIGFAPATGAFVACLMVGLVLAPVARHRHMPFAAIGFASVVSMIPGVFLFRMASGLLQLGSSQTTLELMSATFADGVTAAGVILAMSFGLIAPKLVFDRFSEKAGPET